MNHPESLGVYQAGNTLFVSDMAGILHRFNTQTLQEMGTADLGGRAVQLLVNEDNARVFAAVQGLQKVAVINAANGSFEAYLSLAYTNGNGSGFWLEQDPDLGKIYALTFEGLRQIDAATLVETPIPGAGGGGFECLAVNPVSHEAFVTRYVADELLIANGMTLTTTTVAGLGAIGIAADWIHNTVCTVYPFKLYDRVGGGITPIVAGNDATSVFFHPNGFFYTTAEVNAVCTKLDGGSAAYRNINMFSSTGAVGFVQSSQRVYLLDPAHVAVVDHNSGLLEMIPIENPNPSGILFQSIAVHQTSNRIFCINDGNALDFVTVIEEGPFLNRPLVFIGNNGFPDNVLVLDSASRQVIDRLESPPFGSDFTAIVHAPGSDRMFTSSNQFGFGDKGLAEYRGVGPHAPSGDFGLGLDEPAGIAVLPDESKVFVCDTANDLVVAVNPATQTGTPHNVGDQPIGSSLNPGGTRLYIAESGAGMVRVMDPATESTLTSISTGNNPQQIAIHPFASLGYVTLAGNGSVAVIDLAGNQVATTFPVGPNPGPVCFSASGRRAFVVNRGNNTVSIVDTSLHSVLQTVATVTNPTGVANIPFRNEVWVIGDTAITILNLSNYTTETVVPPLEQMNYTHHFTALTSGSPYPAETLAFFDLLAEWPNAISILNLIPLLP